MNRVVADTMHFVWRFIIGYFITIGVIFGTQWTYFTYLDGYKPTELVQPIKVMNDNLEIAINDRILLFIEIVKYEEADTEIATNITCDDGNLITLVSVTQIIPVGRFAWVNDDYHLPEKVTVGSYCKFNFVVTHRPNPYKTYNRIWSSEEFKVIER